MPYNAQGQWYYDPTTRANNVAARTQYQDSGLQQLAGIAQNQGVAVPNTTPKLGLFQRLISLLRVGETAPAALAALNGQNPFKAYASHVGNSLKSAFTGTPYDAVDYSQVIGKLFGTPTSTPGKIFQKGAGLAGDILLDPTTYLSFGTSKAMTAAGKPLTKAAIPAFKQTVSEIAQKSADDLVRAGVKESPEVLARQLAKDPTTFETARKVWDDAVEAGLPEYTKYLDRGGIKFAGQTVVPGSVFSPIKRVTDKIKTSAIGDNLGRLFSRDYGLSDAQKTLKQQALDLTNYNRTKRLEDLIELAKPISKADDFSKISFAIEKGDNGIAALPKNLQEPAKKFREFIRQLGATGQEKGILGALRDNYVTHVYKNPNADTILEQFAQTNPDKVSSIFKFGKHRQVDNLELAKELGLDPETDISKILARYIDSFSRAEGNAQYLQDLSTKLGKGRPYNVVQDLVKKTTKVPEQVINPKLTKNAYDDLLRQVGYRDFGVDVSANPKNSLLKFVDDSTDKGVAKIDDLKTLLGVQPNQIKKWDDVNSLQRLINDPVIKDDVGRFFLDRKTNIEDFGGKFGDVTEYLTKLKKVQEITEKARKVPLTVDELKKLQDAVGEPLLRYSDPAIGDVLLPESVINDLMQNPQLLDDPDIKGLLKGYDKVLSFWKGSVTSIFPAFHARNAVSNVAQNFLDIGVDAINPVRHTEVVSILLKRKGKLVTDLGEEIPYDQVLDLAKRNGVLGGNFFATEAGRTIDDQLKTGLSKLTKVNPFEYGRKVGGTIEDEARMVNFVSNLHKGLSAVDAAKQTKKFLFDYGNLSRFEKDVMRRLIPFYTWTRKNISLQLITLAKNPGKIATQLKFLRNIGNPVTAEDRQGLPDWAAEQAGFKMGEDQYGRPLFFTNLGLPIESAAGMMKPSSLLSLLSPAIKSPAELLTGQDFFRRKPIQEVYTANDVADFISATAKALNVSPEQAQKTLGVSSYERNVYINGEKTGEKETVYTMNPWVLYALRNLPTSRFVSTLGRSTSPQTNLLQKLLSVGTGVKAYSFDPQEQQYFNELDTRNALENLLKRKGYIGSYTGYYEKK